MLTLYKALVCHDGVSSSLDITSYLSKGTQVFDSTYNGYSTDELFFVCVFACSRLFFAKDSHSSTTNGVADLGIPKARNFLRSTLKHNILCLLFKRSPLEHRMSPTNFVHKWSTPQLLIHGSKDYRLPETEGIGAFHALQQSVWLPT